jgi:4-hydroxy-tetrahydrodipicolinate synthase
MAVATPLPVVMYNVPGRTGVNMTAETTLRLAHEYPNLIAVKEASGDREQIGRIIRDKPAGFQVISGDDALTLDLITAGAAGVISVIGNAFPQQFGRMVHLALNGDFVQAQTIHQQLSEVYELLFVDGSPAGVKNILYRQGYIENELRLPLVPARTATDEKIRLLLQHFESHS